MGFGSGWRGEAGIALWRCSDSVFDGIRWAAGAENIGHEQLLEGLLGLALLALSRVFWDSCHLWKLKICHVSET